MIFFANASVCDMMIAQREEVETMRHVRCYECGKRYDFDVDDFCPRCGAFNPPDRTSRIGADGSVVRIDGLNEINHRESFVHAELHEENKERRASGLAKGSKRSPQRAAARPARAAQKRGQTAPNSIGNIIKWVIAVIIGLNVLSGLISSLF